jgi:Cu(I)/Ag(I) efflux system membrane protein CusA/SilA
MPDRIELALRNPGSGRSASSDRSKVLNVVGIVPVMIDTGIGSDVAKRIAAPLWGGLVSLTILTLAGIPVLYVIWRGFQLRHQLSTAEP